ncbi:MAG: cell division protein SepF [Clostridiales bacterium]|nr:cell division protein SepF [Clostridiales bacterium]
MGLFDKIKQGINPETDPAYDDQDMYTQQIQNDFNDNLYQQPQQQYAPPQQEQYAPQPADTGMSVSGSSLELKVVKPERFDAVPQIANHLLNRRTVVLNLEETNKETARRLLDFLSGVAYSINGNLKRVANNTYVITPCNVDVTGDQLRDKRQKEESADLYSNDI